MNRKILTFFLLFLSLIFIISIAYAYLFPTSPLNKKSPVVTSTLIPQPTSTFMLQPTPTIALVTIKRGDEEEFIAGPNCSELFKMFQQIQSKAMMAATKEGEEIKMEELEMEYNKIADVNQDGKVDFSDGDLITKNMKDEKWCQEALTRR